MLLCGDAGCGCPGRGGDQEGRVVHAGVLAGWGRQRGAPSAAAIARSSGSSRRWMRVDVRTAARRSVPAGREGWGGNWPRRVCVECATRTSTSYCSAQCGSWWGTTGHGIVQRRSYDTRSSRLHNASVHQDPTNNEAARGGQGRLIATPSPCSRTRNGSEPRAFVQWHDAGRCLWRCCPNVDHLELDLHAAGETKEKERGDSSSESVRRDHDVRVRLMDDVWFIFFYSNYD